MGWDELRGKCTLKTGLENSDYPCPSLPELNKQKNYTQCK